jgi:hypothetical protein
MLRIGRRDPDFLQGGVDDWELGLVR